MLQVTDLYPPVIGGLELAVQALSRELVRRGHEVVVATQAVAGAPEHGDDAGVHVIRIPGWAQRLLRGSYENPSMPLHPTAPDPGMVRRLQQTIDDFRPDVIHVHGWISHSLLAVPALRGASIVVGLHDYGLVCAKKTLVRDGVMCPGPSLGTCPGCAGRHYGRAKGIALATGLRLGRPLLRRVDGFIANSRAVADASRRAVPAHAQIEVIAPASDPPDPHTVLDRPAFLPAADGFVLFVGALGSHKGLHVLLEAHERFGLGADLVVIGARRADTPARFPDGVTVAENVDRDGVMAAWRHCALGVVPSVWPEPFGMVAVEVMSAGRPVVASNIGGLPDIVTDGETGVLVPPGDARALACAVRALVADEPRRSAMGAAALRRSASFSLAATVDRVEDFYRRLGGH